MLRTSPVKNLRLALSLSELTSAKNLSLTPGQVGPRSRPNSKYSTSRHIACLCVSTSGVRLGGAIFRGICDCLLFRNGQTCVRHVWDLSQAGVPSVRNESMWRLSCLVLVFSLSSLARHMRIIHKPAFGTEIDTAEIHTHPHTSESTLQLYPPCGHHSLDMRDDTTRLYCIQLYCTYVRACQVPFGAGGQPRRLGPRGIQPTAGYRDKKQEIPNPTHSPGERSARTHVSSV